MATILQVYFIPTICLLIWCCCCCFCKCEFYGQTSQEVGDDDEMTSAYHVSVQDQRTMSSSTILPQGLAETIWRRAIQWLKPDMNEARGPKDMLAIISTLLATILGAIVVKLNVLIFLSVVSVFIGKLILFVLTLKSKLFQNEVIHTPPIIYEKTYIPHEYQPSYHQQQPYHYHQQNDVYGREQNGPSESISYIN